MIKAFVIATSNRKLYIYLPTFHPGEFASVSPIREYYFKFIIVIYIIPATDDDDDVRIDE